MVHLNKSSLLSPFPSPSSSPSSSSSFSFSNSNSSSEDGSECGMDERRGRRLIADLEVDEGRDREGELDDDLGEDVEEELLFLRLWEEEDFLSILRIEEGREGGIGRLRISLIWGR